MSFSCILVAYGLGYKFEALYDDALGCFGRQQQKDTLCLADPDDVLCTQVAS